MASRPKGQGLRRIRAVFRTFHGISLAGADRLQRMDSVFVRHQVPVAVQMVS